MGLPRGAPENGAMMDSSVRESLRAGTWLFLGSITISLTGLLFWLVISRLSGAESIGVASSIFSSAAIASTLVSAGINIGVMREVAARGPKAVTPGLLAALILGLAASTLAIPLCHLLGYMGWLVLLAAVFAGLNVILTFILSMLQGLTRFNQVFLVVTVASLSKLLLGVGLAALGLGALAAVAGFTIYSIIGVILGLALILSCIGAGMDWETFREILRLGYANYPFVLSNQLVTVLAVYLFALYSGSQVDTGRLYISLMIAL
ncbi:MAG: oligosaccharide flippase family protein, partial [Crenarchaeota archaeon]|nr:oligosaccharide flippase family protein [Thermoproteota archaeon]